jgi:hypothetical protein
VLHFVVDDGAKLQAALKSDARLGAHLLGRSWAASAVGWAGLPVTAAEHVEPTGQIRGAVAARSGALGYAIAIPLQNPGALLAVVTAGEGARFRRRAADGFDHLVLAKGDDGKRRVLVGGFLVVAGSDDDFAELGPFVSQKAPLFAPVTGEEPALATVSVDRRAALAALDPVIGQVRALVPALGAKLPVALPEALVVRVDAPPGALSFTTALGGLEAGAQPPTGPSSRLLDLPSGTQAGLALFLGESSRAEAASAGADALAAGPLGSAAAVPLAGALKQLAEARGDALLLGFERATTGPLLSGRADLRDEKRAQGGLEALVLALREKAVAEAVSGQGLSIEAESTVLERVGGVTRVRLARDDEIVSSILARVEGGQLSFCAGADAVKGLRRLLAAEPSARLAGIPAVADLAALLGPDVLAAAVVDAAGPPLTDPGAGAVSRAFILGSLERRDTQVVGRIVAEPGALAALLDR